MTTKIETMRQQVREIFLAGVVAADPRNSVLSHLNDSPLNLADNGKLFIVAIGKAALGMAESVLDHFESHPDVTAIAVTNYENHEALQQKLKNGRSGFSGTCYAAGHPVPDANGLIAAKSVKELVENADEKDFVLFLISGGGSALLPLPAIGLSLEDKMDVNTRLLASGADITQMNLVRQTLSAIKGGRLAACARPARMRSLILSDVIGDDLRVIASGPTIAPIGNNRQARQILEDLDLFDQLPMHVQAHLQQDDDHDGAAISENKSEAVLVGSNAGSVEAMMKHCKGVAKRIEIPLDGTVDEAALFIMQQVEDAKPGVPLLFGGETTVHLKGDGLGGRNQELALRVAMLMEQADYQGDWIFLSGGTDGRDGPTDAAGAIVDGGTLSRIREAGGNPQALLDNNDSYHALSMANDLLLTGATGTNVADLQIFLIS